MNIDKLIENLTALRNSVGGDARVLVASDDDWFKIDFIELEKNPDKKDELDVVVTVKEHFEN